MKYCYIVIFKNLSDQNAKENITRVFTKKEDAEVFIDDCKTVEVGPWRHKILRAELDGDPLTGFFGVHEA